MSYDIIIHTKDNKEIRKQIEELIELKELIEALGDNYLELRAKRVKVKEKR